MNYIGRLIENIPEDSDLICSICKDIMMTCVALPCGHEFCADCMRMISKSSIVECQMCRKEFPISSRACGYKTQSKTRALKLKCRYKCGNESHNYITITDHEKKCEINPGVILIREIDEILDVFSNKRQKLETLIPTIDESLLKGKEHYLMKKRDRSDKPAK